jgi:2-polyprenyl-3-methyl-5-hydroxy-6-metoxy-1,4-benzoquinol methylase
MNQGFSGYIYTDAAPAHTHSYLLPIVDRALAEMAAKSVFDLGCGNGSVVKRLSKSFEVIGVDYSASGIAEARAAFPGLRFEHRSAYEDLAAEFGQFDAVVSLEVVEHLFDPRTFARRIFDLLRPGGGAVISTPFHGYWKNIALASTGKMDAHFTALWDGGHIKFWSVRTLRMLLEEAGFVDIRFKRAGRIRALAKSMIAIARRPA